MGQTEITRKELKTLADRLYSIVSGIDEYSLEGGNYDDKIKEVEEELRNYFTVSEEVELKKNESLTA